MHQIHHKNIELWTLTIKNEEKDYVFKIKQAIVFPLVWLKHNILQTYSGWSHIMTGNLNQF